MPLAPDPQLIADLTAQFTAETRLYELSGDGPLAGLMPERWQASDALSTLSELELVALSTDVNFPLADTIGQRVNLLTTRADGEQHTRSAVVRRAELLAGDGGLARYRFTLVPWLWYLTIGRHNRVFQDKTVIDIVEQVFADYASIAAWTLADDVGPFLQDARPYGYCVQYRESDYDFIARILAEQGLGFSFIQDDTAPMGHALYLFADSAGLPEDPTSAADTGGPGIRFHRASSQEAQDAIQALGAQRQLEYGQLTATSFDYKSKSSTSVSIATDKTNTDDNIPALESYDAPGAYAFADASDAERSARLAMQAAEARHKTWLGQSTVRTLASGTRFTLTESNLDLLSQTTGNENERDKQFTVISIAHHGINNLPTDLAKRIEARLGSQEQSTNTTAHGEAADPELLKNAKRTGYANTFTALRRDIPWRPALTDDTGRRHNPRPTVPGAQTATVTGPNGELSPAGADEVYTDALGRIKVKFHWQTGHTPDDRLSCWLRTTQGYAGPGYGSHFIPRIGQEVLVQFLHGDIDRPIITGSAYNGQGEAGIAPTPGGQAGKSDADAYKNASDQAPSAQGNLSAGNAPAWHGGAGADEDHRNPAALSGIKSKEFGGPGYSQLVFDDADAQQRAQAATTQAASQLNLGHLIHQQDNYRGSFRGAGFELRSDAYGAIRGQRGVLLSTYGIQDSDPAGDFTAGSALLKQANTLGQSYSNIATTHTTTALAAHLGAAKANQASIDDQASPLAALLKTANGMVDGKQIADAMTDAHNKNTAAGPDKLPHSADPILAIAAKAGIGMVAGQDMHWHAGETLSIASGKDHNQAIGEQLRIHSGQSIGILAGAQGQGEGLKLIAAQGDVDLQAQADQMKVQAKDQIKLVSANAEAEFAAKQAVHLATAGGASITLEGGKITMSCPGNMTIHAGQKVFTGGSQMSREFNKWPVTKFDDAYVVRNRRTLKPMPNTKVELIRSDGAKMQLVTDSEGRLPKQQGESIEQITLRILGPE